MVLSRNYLVKAKKKKNVGKNAFIAEGEGAVGYI